MKKRKSTDKKSLKRPRYEGYDYVSMGPYSHTHHRVLFFLIAKKVKNFLIYVIYKSLLNPLFSISFF